MRKITEIQPFIVIKFYTRKIFKFLTNIVQGKYVELFYYNQVFYDYSKRTSVSRCINKKIEIIPLKRKQEILI